jgi:hypothetical protein
MSTGDLTILGRITKRGNRYLRTLFMQGACVILLRPANWMKHSFGPWLTAAAQRLHHNVLATALANKLARITWTVLAQARNYDPRVEPGMELPELSPQELAVRFTDEKKSLDMPSADPSTRCSRSMICPRTSSGTRFQTGSGRE